MGFILNSTNLHAGGRAEAAAMLGAVSQGIIAGVTVVSQPLAAWEHLGRVCKWKRRNCTRLPWRTFLMPIALISSLDMDVCSCQRTQLYLQVSMMIRSSIHLEFQWTRTGRLRIHQGTCPLGRWHSVKDLIAVVAASRVLLKCLHCNTTFIRGTPFTSHSSILMACATWRQMMRSYSHHHGTAKALTSLGRFA